MDIELLLGSAYSFGATQLSHAGFSAEIDLEDDAALAGDARGDLLTDQGYIFISDLDEAAQLAAWIDANMENISSVNWSYGWHPEIVEEVLSALVAENERQRSKPVSTASSFFNVESLGDSVACGESQIKLDLFSEVNG
jgi:hypothetical protein